jgi:hypothetical protein
MIYKTLHRKLKTEQHNPIEKQWLIHVLLRKGKQLTTQLWRKWREKQAIKQKPNMQL